MNLPNALTVGRIAATPLIAALPLANSWGLRLTAFILFTIAAVTDYIDGYLARSRKEETDLGRLLDPLADKLLLVATLIPMYLLARTLPFVTPIGAVGLPLWIIIVVLGREIFMTFFRQAAARRGVVIAAIGPLRCRLGAIFLRELEHGVLHDIESVLGIPDGKQRLLVRPPFHAREKLG